jgi:uncharacterized Zn finger protein
MGMFDTVHIRCPECGTDVEFQSKAGDCTLADYYPLQDETPAVIITDLAGRSSPCEKCGTIITLELVTKPTLGIKKLK